MKTNISFILGRPYISPEAVVMEIHAGSALLQTSQLEDYDENVII